MSSNDTLPWRHNGPDSVSNHQPYDCLLNRLSDADQRKHQSSASLAFVREIHRGPVNFPHKWPVTRKMFPFDDVIMRKHNYDCEFQDSPSIMAIIDSDNGLSSVQCQAISPRIHPHADCLPRCLMTFLQTFLYLDSTFSESWSQVQELSVKWFLKTTAMLSPLLCIKIVMNYHGCILRPPHLPRLQWPGRNR